MWSQTQIMPIFCHSVWYLSIQSCVGVVLCSWSSSSALLQQLALKIVQNIALLKKSYSPLWVWVVGREVRSRQSSLLIIISLLIILQFIAWRYTLQMTCVVWNRLYVSLSLECCFWVHTFGLPNYVCVPMYFIATTTIMSYRLCIRLQQGVRYPYSLITSPHQWLANNHPNTNNHTASSPVGLWRRYWTVGRLGCLVVSHCSGTVL